MRVLVTGGGGFVGRQAVAALRMLGAEVIAPAHAALDLLDPAARRLLPEADVLLHTAWVTRHGAYWTSPENLLWISATLDLARRFAAAGGRRIVFVGTCAEYGWALPARAPWNERRACRPHTPYGAAKLLAWTALQELAARSGVGLVNARLFWPVGRHEAPERLLPSLLGAALTGRPVAVGPAGLTRDLLDVRDAGAALARLALAAVQGVVNVGSGVPVRLDELAARVAGVGSPLVRLGARPLRAGEPLVMVADPTRLIEATGFAPRYTLAETIADAAAHWRAPALAA
jgi:nucleoside-diphosphate-sugar epimerase